mmetsp:Transcript_30519/g.91485  ORF Transcript_30519/g.91485 Transcript_30519/m.91485 type:complete len:631 (-) Transcript_30519:32-1924(-)
MAEPSQVEVRFGHLLKPIRDLAENWDVDVASELEDYLDEIGRLAFAFDGSKDVFNFAQAALLIQGSACVYSKKVEYLYQLVYETLDLLASKKKLAQGSSLDASGKDRDVQDFAEDEMSFLPLDDLPEDTNIDLVETGQIQKTKGITRTPMVLVPLEACEKSNDSVLQAQNGTAFGNRSDFKMNTSIIHESGTLLLGVDDALYVDQSFQAPNVSGMASVGLGNAATAPPHGMVDVAEDMYDDDDGDLGGFDHSFDQPDFGDDVDPLDAPEPVAATPNINVVAASRHDGAVDRMVTALPVDPWAPLDPHEVPAAAGQKNTFRRIKTYRIPSHLTDKPKGKKKKQNAKELPLPPISQYCLEAFLPRPKSSVPKGVRAPAFKEFASLYAAEQSRRNIALRKAEAAAREREREGHSLQHTSENTRGNLELDPLELSAVPLDMSGDDGDGYYDDGPDDYDDDIDYATVEATHPGASALDGMTVDTTLPDYGAAMPGAAAAATTFEDLVRQHIETYIAETQKYAVETDLTRRVQDWEDRIRPELEMEASRKPFDIHAYGKDMLSMFGGKRSKTAPFEDLVRKCDKFEVSRLFLASLQLANNGNVEIIRDASGCSMQLKLLSSFQNSVKDNIGSLVVA